jgi:hypothetical protein
VVSRRDPGNKVIDGPQSCPASARDEQREPGKDRRDGKFRKGQEETDERCPQRGLFLQRRGRTCQPYDEIADYNDTN